MSILSSDVYMQPYMPPYKTPIEEKIMELENENKKLKERLYAVNVFKKQQKKIELPERYIINDGATILFWKDETKTVVKRASDDEFNPRLAFLTAFFQHYCGMSKNKANKYLASLQVEQKPESKEERVEEKPKRGRPKKNTSKFKVGDKVIGNELADKTYTITKKGWIGKVIEIVNEECIKVAGKACPTGIVLRSECFDKYGEDK